VSSSPIAPPTKEEKLQLIGVKEPSREMNDPLYKAEKLDEVMTKFEV
jgi:hypothetical protein